MTTEDAIDILDMERKLAIKGGELEIAEALALALVALLDE